MKEYTKWEQFRLITPKWVWGLGVIAYMGENSWNRDIERLFGQITAWSCGDPSSLTFGKSDIDLHLEAYCMELKLKDILRQMMFFKLVTLSECRNYLRRYKGWNK